MREFKEGEVCKGKCLTAITACGDDNEKGKATQKEATKG